MLRYVSAYSLTVALTVWGSGCSTSTISLDSSPGRADVYATPIGGGVTRKIGETPISLKAKEILKDSDGVGPVLIEFKKDGYNSTKALITDLSAIDINVKMELTPLSGLEDQDRVNAMVDRVFESQRLALAGRFEEAIKTVKLVQKDVPQLAASYEIEAGVYYLQKKWPLALDSYRLAARYNPKNPETVRMRNLLEEALGVSSRVPAGFNPPVAAEPEPFNEQVPSVLISPKAPEGPSSAALPAVQLPPATSATEAAEPPPLLEGDPR